MARPGGRLSPRVVGSGARMSIKVMAAVWDRSQHAGTELLMLLALADFSDDRGYSYPGVSALAEKCRMKPRNANYILATLQKSGELQVLVNEGPKGTNRYRIVLDALGGVQGVAGVGVQPSAGVQGVAGLQPSAPTPAMECAKPLQPIAAEPSLNRQEPSGRRKPAKAPACPFAEIVGAYHEALPELPAVRILDSGDRRAKTQAFWTWLLASTKTDGKKRASTADEAMTWIRSYFERARSNDFLMGRTGRSEGHKNWRCDFDYLLTDRGRRQVIEKTEVSA